MTPELESGVPGRIRPWLRPVLAIIAGTILGAAPLVVRPPPDWFWWLAFVAAPILVWYGFLSATEVLHPRARFFENVIVSALAYLATGVAWIAFLLLGLLPFDLGGLPLTYLVFALAWPTTFLWILFGSLSWFPMS